MIETTAVLFASGDIKFALDLPLRQEIEDDLGSFTTATTAAGRVDLAKRVKWVSKDIGDGLGYDIRSFDQDGNEVFLEVKTTTSGRATPFFVSNNEVAVSGEKGDSYRLVRVFNFSKKPRFFSLTGSLSEVLQLEATSYRARVL